VTWQIKLLNLCINLLSSRFNPASAGSDIAVPSDVMFTSGFYTGGHAGFYVGSLSKLCKTLCFRSSEDSSRGLGL
jgi:hypothetical protein